LSSATFSQIPSVEGQGAFDDLGHTVTQLNTALIRDPKTEFFLY
jgi:hypothetical protein